MVKAIDVTVNMNMDQISLKNYRDLFFAVISVFLLNVMEGKELCFSICIYCMQQCRAFLFRSGSKTKLQLFSSETGQKTKLQLFSSETSQKKTKLHVWNPKIYLILNIYGLYLIFLIFFYFTPTLQFCLRLIFLNPE